MSALCVASRILSLASACALLVCGALAAAGVHWVPGLGWVAATCFFVGAWEGR